MSGVGPCACADCFDDTMHSDIARPELCDACEAAGCNPNGVHHACQRDDAYGADDVVVETVVQRFTDDDEIVDAIVDEDGPDIDDDGEPGALPSAAFDTIAHYIRQGDGFAPCPRCTVLRPFRVVADVGNGAMTLACMMCGGRVSALDATPAELRELGRIRAEVRP